MLKSYFLACLFGFSCTQFICAEVQDFPSGGIHKDPKPDQKKQITPDCYFRTGEILRIPSDYQWGFSWYSVALPIFQETIAGIQIGLGSTWINPNNEIHSAAMQEIAKKCSYRGSMNDPTLWVQFQSMEGSLGWWVHTKFPSKMPKYKLDSWKDFYSFSVSSPGYNVSDGTKPYPLPQGAIGPVYLSNRILIPPDGLPTTEKSSGSLLGVAWYPLTISKEWRQDGFHTWAVFFNSKNFKGPLIFHPEEFWERFPAASGSENHFGLNRQPAVIRTMASEWGTVPYKRFTDKEGKNWSKIPAISFPADHEGRTVLVRDVRAYEKLLGDEISQALLSDETISLADLIKKRGTSISLTAVNSPYFQEGKKLELRKEFNLVTFDNQTAFGFQWNDKKEGIQELPSYFKEQGDARLPVQESEVPKELVESKFRSGGDTNFKFETPAWWFDDAEVDSKEYTADLTDKTTVTYRWVRFKDQPAVKALKLSEEQRDKLQKAVEKIHKSCAAGSDFMAPPTKGELAEFDPGLLVNPPEGKEVGWVPLIVRQEIVAR